MTKDKEKRMTPEIRFKGFSDDWEQRKVCDLSKETYGGGTPKTGVKEYWSGDLAWIQSSDLKTEMLYNVNPSKYISESAVQNSATKEVPANSIAVVTRVGVGKLALIPYNYATSQDFLSLSNLVINQWFGVYGLYNLLQRELHNIQGTSIKGMTKSDLLNKKIFIPRDKEEQSKIGSFFKQLDDTITLHQQKYELLLKLKQAYLQLMFPQTRESTPQVRFADFHDSWERRKFNKIYKKVIEKNDLSFGPSQIISVANMYYKVHDDKSKSTDDYMRTYNVMRVGDIAFEGNKNKNYSYGRFVENDIGDGIVSHVFDVFRPIVNYELNFWKYYINNENVMGHILRKVTTKATMMTNLVAKDFLKTSILVPSMEEQQKIGLFFQRLDQSISLHQQKIASLKSLKQAYLQKMFV